MLGKTHVLQQEVCAEKPGEMGPHFGLGKWSDQRHRSERGLSLSPQRGVSVSKRIAECCPFSVPSASVCGAWPSPSTPLRLTH